MDPVSKDFVSEDPRKFHFRIGRLLASSLAGFVAGVIVASIVWAVGVWYVGQVQKLPSSSPVITASSK